MNQHIEMDYQRYRGLAISYFSAVICSIIAVWDFCVPVRDGMVHFIPSYRHQATTLLCCCVGVGSFFFFGFTSGCIISSRSGY